jgi:hypothetical protein
VAERQPRRVTPGQNPVPRREDRIDGQAGFQTVCGAELAILDLTAALEDAVEDLDAPAPRPYPQGFLDGL